MLSPWSLPWGHQIREPAYKLGETWSQTNWLWMRQSPDRICLHKIQWCVLSLKTLVNQLNQNLMLRRQAVVMTKTSDKLFPPGTDTYCPPEYILKGEFHGKPATVWSLGILLFRMLRGRFPDSFDFYRTNLNTWSKPGLTEGEFLSTSTIQMQKCIGCIGDGHMDKSEMYQFSDLKILQLRIRRADVD